MTHSAAGNETRKGVTNGGRVEHVRSSSKPAHRSTCKGAKDRGKAEGAGRTAQRHAGPAGGTTTRRTRRRRLDAVAGVDGWCFGCRLLAGETRRHTAASSRTQPGRSAHGRKVREPGKSFDENHRSAFT